MKNTVLDLRGRYWKIEKDIKDNVKAARLTKTLQATLFTEVKIQGLEAKRKAVGSLLLKAEYEVKQLEKDFRRKPATNLKGRK